MPIVVKGLLQTRSALRKFAPDLLKTSDASMRVVLKDIVKDARGFAPSTSPLSGWATSEHGRKITRQSSVFGGRLFPKYNPVTVRAGLVSHIGGAKANRGRFKSVYSLQNKSAAGAIYETAGRKSAGQKQGVNFIDQIEKKSGYRQPVGKKEGRLAFRAVEKNNGKAIIAIQESVTLAANLCNARMKGGVL